MHQMLTILTDVRGVCQSVCMSVCLSRGLNWRWCVQSTLRAVCTGSFSEAFAKCLWPLVTITNYLLVISSLRQSYIPVAP